MNSNFNNMIARMDASECRLVLQMSHARRATVQVELLPALDARIALAEDRLRRLEAGA